MTTSPVRYAVAAALVGVPAGVGLARARIARQVRHPVQDGGATLDLKLGDSFTTSGTR